MSKKIALMHDSFLYKGWGERLVSLMARSLNADIVSGFFASGSFDPRSVWFTGNMVSLWPPIQKKWWRHLILKWRFLAKAMNLKHYDTVIFSGDCLEALSHVRHDARVYYYCHTPPRYLFDFRETYLKSIPRIFRPIFALAFRFFAYSYGKRLSRFHGIFTNSHNTRKRLLEYCGYDSHVVYPPVDLTLFTPREVEVSLPSIPQNYFLSFARLSPPKRVDLIIESFLTLPDQNLVFTYGKNDPQREALLSKVNGAKNIFPIESPDDTTLISLIQWATATLYIPINEDFGMSPVESMACGTPVIGANEWWLRETLLDGVTGKLITILEREEGKEILKSVIESTPRNTWSAMKSACRDRAKQFSLENFEKTLHSIVHS